MFKVACREPLKSRHTVVTEANNLVVVMMPLVQVAFGMATAHGCSALSTTAAFFGEDDNADVEEVSVLDDLERHRAGLLFDIAVLDDDAPCKAQKIRRLEQIEQYITAVQSIKTSGLLAPIKGVTDGFRDYPQPIKNLLKHHQTNIYSMRLSPSQREQNAYLRMLDLTPVFMLSRVETNQPFYRALQTGYQRLVIRTMTPQAQLQRITTESLRQEQGATDINFEAIQTRLTQTTKELFGQDVNYAQDKQANPVTKDSIEIIMGGPSDDVADYVDLLINCCAPDLWTTVHPDSIFMVENTPRGKEMLIIWTQFFFATVNIFCYSNQLTVHNFGEILDDVSSNIHQHIPAIVTLALQEGRSVENALLDFINNNYRDFFLSRPLTQAEMDLIITKFTDQSRVISNATHFDEFMVFEENKPGHGILHQGALCISLAELINEPGFRHRTDTPYFERVRREYPHTLLPRTASHGNEWLKTDIEIDEARLAPLLLTLMENQTTRHIAVELLTSDTDDGRKVLHRLEPTVITTLKTSPHWASVRIEVLRRMVQTDFHDSIGSPVLPVSLPHHAANRISVHQIAPSLGRFGIHARPIAARAEPELVVSNPSGEELLKQLILQSCQGKAPRQGETIVPTRLWVGVSHLSGLQTLIYEKRFYLELRGNSLHLVDKYTRWSDEITDPAQRNRRLNQILLSIPTSKLLNVHLRAQTSTLLERNSPAPGTQMWLEDACQQANIALVTPITMYKSGWLFGRLENGNPYFENLFCRLEIQPNGEITFINLAARSEVILKQLSDLFVQLKEALAIAEAAVSSEMEPTSSTYTHST